MAKLGASAHALEREDMVTESLGGLEVAQSTLRCHGRKKGSAPAHGKESRSLILSLLSTPCPVCFGQGRGMDNQDGSGDPPL